MYKPKLKTFEEAEIDELALKLARYMDMKELGDRRYKNMPVLTFLKNNESFYTDVFVTVELENIIQRAMMIKIESDLGPFRSISLDIPDARNFEKYTTDEVCYVVELAVNRLIKQHRTEE